jgi:hypothetical protein
MFRIPCGVQGAEPENKQVLQITIPRKEYAHEHDLSRVSSEAAKRSQ